MTPAARTILLVDDEPHVQLALVRALERHGHAVTTASSAAEAVKLAPQLHPDILILDINLPDATGWDVLRRLTAGTQPVPPVIVMSAVPPRRERIREFQPRAVLTKPFPIEALLRHVQHPALERESPRTGTEFPEASTHE